jgi:hypothetical protein
MNRFGIYSENRIDKTGDPYGIPALIEKYFGS